MRCGCILVVVAIALILFGGQGIYDAYAYRKPVVMSSDVFIKSPPQAGWYRITGCVIDVTEAVYAVSTSGAGSESKTAEGDPAITEVYLPVHSLQELAAESHQDKPVSLVIKTDDEALISTIKEIHRLDDSKPEEAKKWLTQHIDQLMLHRDIAGMVQAGITSDSKTRDEIAKVHGSLTPNYVILEEGKKPSMGSGVGMLVGGIVVGIIAALYWVSRLAGGAGKQA